MAKKTVLISSFTAGVMLLATLSNVQAGTTELISMSLDGRQGNGPYYYNDNADVSDDGRFVVFSSDSKFLVEGDTNGYYSDIFLRDRLTGETKLISVNNDGVQGNNRSYTPSISGNGRYVVFWSAATNFIDGDPEGSDVFVRDLQEGTTEIVNVNNDGVKGNGNNMGPYFAERCAISVDGRYVVFSSNSNNLDPNDTNFSTDLYLRDRLTGTTELVSANSNGVSASKASHLPAISDDGRYVAFESAGSLVPGDSNRTDDIYVRDLLYGTNKRVSVNSDGVLGNDTSNFASISHDGRYVAYQTRATNLFPGDTELTWDILIYDMETDTTEVIPRGNGEAFHPRISGNGRFVTFLSYASNLVAGDTNDKMDVFVYDRQTGTTERVSMNSDGTQGDYHSGHVYPNINGDGRFVVFGSFARNLVYPVERLTTTYDYFLHDRLGDVVLDTDNDGVLDDVDNCPSDPNTDQADTDNDGQGDVCDTDDDNDGVLDVNDNCPLAPNADQADNENDSLGDVCDQDDDGDAIPDVNDNCPLVANFDQADMDGDLTGDVCDPDIDGDNVLNGFDNCPYASNSGQEDNDGDGFGDVCDEDDDNDSVPDTADNCQWIANTDQIDFDADGEGDVCDPDDDNDGILDETDNCPFAANSDQADFDGDGQGDVCDADIDNDGVVNDTPDQCEFTPLGEAVDPATGCSVNQYVPCDGPMGSGAPWRNHGQFVSTLTQILNDFVEQDIITEAERAQLLNQGAQSGCGG